VGRSVWAARCGPLGATRRGVAQARSLRNRSAAAGTWHSAIPAGAGQARSLRRRCAAGGTWHHRDHQPQRGWSSAGSATGTGDGGAGIHGSPSGHTSHSGTANPGIHSPAITMRRDRSDRTPSAKSHRAAPAWERSQPGPTQNRDRRGAVVPPVAPVTPQSWPQPARHDHRGGVVPPVAPAAP
jgi:hypothetical protein